MLPILISLILCVSNAGDARHVLYTSTKSTHIYCKFVISKHELPLQVPVISLLNSKLLLNALQRALKDALRLEHYCSRLIKTKLYI
jgi:hypothetical protein